ncbi:MAG TPA: helicase-associated domain-containing protein [Dermatophilaceae bacterium]|nr:helicase-associated domain-containing protein [Dermatophilaceae bacterium]
MTTAGLRATEQVRSLADDLRSRHTDDLTALVTFRPDLVRPAPADLTALAARAGTRASVNRALDRLDAGQLQVLEALVVAGDPVDLAVAASLLGTTAGRIEPVVEYLWRLALLWRSALPTPASPPSAAVGGACGPADLAGSPDPAGVGVSYHVSRTAAEALGPEVAGLAPADAVPGARGPHEPAEIDRCLADAPEPARAILRRLTWGPPRGTLEVNGPLGEPLRWLLSAGLLRETGSGEVLLPQAVALRLRRGRLYRASQLDPPQVPVSTGFRPDPAAGSGQASRVLEMVDELATVWGRQPPRVLRAGGVAVRDVRLLAAAVQVPEPQAALLVEVAFAAGLIADDQEAPPSWALTDRYDAWREQPAGERWLWLVRAWLTSTRAAFLVGRRSLVAPARAADGVNALSEGVVWPPVRSARRMVLGEFLDLDPVGHPDLAALRDRLRWRRPRLAAGPVPEVADAVLREAELLGVTAGALLAPAVRELLRPDRPPKAATQGPADTVTSRASVLADVWLPPAAADLVLQADLTAVVPGRLEGEIGDCLRAAAVPESRGVASVYRFSPDSVGRALDLGWSPERLLDVLSRFSRTPVPQPLRYLVTDAGRRHGTVAVGAATTYLRSEDPGVIEAILGMPELSAAGWHRLAPTVLVGSLPPSLTLARLRAVGLAPVVDNPTGGVLVPPAQPRRVRRPTPAAADADLQLKAPRLPGRAEAGLVDRLRRAESVRDGVEPGALAVSELLPGRSRDGTGPGVPSTDPAVTIAILREASTEGRSVWMGVVDTEGMAVTMLFHPSWVEAGRVHGTVEGSPQPKSVTVSRIVGIREVDDQD